MGSRALILLRGGSSSYCSSSSHIILLSNVKTSVFSKSLGGRTKLRNFSTTKRVEASLQPPDLPRLAETARISLTATEVEEFAPKIRQVVDWFGQLQAVDLQSIEPSIRAETEGDNSRDDVPRTFENREAMIAAVPVFDEPYIKVPKVLNKE